MVVADVVDVVAVVVLLKVGVAQLLVPMILFVLRVNKGAASPSRSLWNRCRKTNKAAGRNRRVVEVVVLFDGPLSLCLSSCRLHGHENANGAAQYNIGAIEYGRIESRVV